MKITPIEIRQKTFEKHFRGYDKDEVSAFLLTLSQEWEKIMDENKELKFKYEASEREVKKLREVESSLYKTLKTAEDTGNNLIEQANKTAELHVKEMQMKAEMVLNDAKSKAKAIVDEADNKSKKKIDEMIESLRVMEREYHSLESLRENLILDLKHLATDLMDKLERTQSNMKRKHDILTNIAPQKKEENPSVAPASDPQSQKESSNKSFFENLDI